MQILQAVGDLAVECFEILSDGVKVGNYSEYEFALLQDWNHFAQQYNEAAAAFIGANPLPEGHGYILTATSKSEYDYSHRELLKADRLKGDGFKPGDGN